MNKKCLECGTELTSSEAIIFHTCEAYPKQAEKSWLDFIPQEREENGN